MTALAEFYLRKMGISRLDAALAAGRHERTPAVQAIERALQDRGQFVTVLWGERGSGKTVAAAIWLARVSRYLDEPLEDTPSGWEFLRQRAAFVKAYVLGRMNLRFNLGDRAEFERMKTVTWLALDDLGAEDELAVPLVEDLIDQRSSNGRWTVLTTNLPFLAVEGSDRMTFERRYGARTVDRVTANGVFSGCGATNLRRRSTP